MHGIVDHLYRRGAVDRICHRGKPQRGGLQKRLHYIRSFRADNTRAVCARHDGLQRSVGRRHHTYRHHIEVLSTLVKAKLFLTAREHHRNDAQR